MPYPETHKPHRAGKPQPKPRRSLVDLFFGNLARRDLAPAPPARIPKPNTPRAMPNKTGPLTPIRQSDN